MENFWPIGLVEMIAPFQRELTAFQHDHPDDYAKAIVALFEEELRSGNAS